MKMIFSKTMGLLAITAGLMGAPQAQAVTIDWVSVGNVGNAADNATGFGAVGYDYRIARTETNLNDYAEFLNATAATDTHGLYSTNMASDARIAGITRSGSSGSFSYAVTGSGLRPVTYVSWLDAARFVNWVSNGQGAGDTETGTYALNGATNGIFTAAAGASVYLPTEDEWYKAAYYDPTIGAGDDGDNYWLYPTQSDAVPSNDLPDAGNNANFRIGSDFTLGGPDRLTDGGAFTGSGSFYGTFDQGGNVWEWNDAVIGSSRGLRGGSWEVGEDGLRSSGRDSVGSTFATAFVGFRLASVPEPTSGVLVMLGCVGMLARRRR